MATDETDVIPQRKQLFADRVNQRGVIAFGEVCPANGAVE